MRRTDRWNCRPSSSQAARVSGSGYAMLFPGALRWKDSVAQGGIEATRLVSGVIPMLVVAGSWRAFSRPRGRRCGSSSRWAGCCLRCCCCGCFRPVKDTATETSKWRDEPALLLAAGSRCRCPADPGADAGRGFLPATLASLARNFRAPCFCSAHRFYVCLMRWSLRVFTSSLELAGALCVAACRDRVRSGVKHGMPIQRKKGDWRDFLIILVLGLAVDLRWMEPAWPTRLTALGKMLLLDAGIFGFLAVRQLDGVDLICASGCGMPVSVCASSVSTLPIAISLGLSLASCTSMQHGLQPLQALGAYRLHVSLYCHSRGAVLSRMAAESVWSGAWAAPRPCC